MSETANPPDGGEQLSEKDQQMLEAAKGLVPGQTQQPAAQQPAAGQQPAGEITGQQPAQQPGTGADGQDPTAQPQVQKPVEVKTAFGTQTFGGEGGPVLTSFEDVQAYAKEQGFEFKAPDDLRQLFDTISDLKVKAEDLPRLQSAVNNYQAQLGSLPPEVMNVVEAAIAGQDYKSIIKDLAAGASIDLARPFAEHQTLNIVRHYVEPGMTQEAYDELTPANKSAVNAVAKEKYTTDQQRWTKATQDKTAQNQEHQVNFDKSIEVAISNLQKEFPTMDQSTLKTVAERMKFGFKDTLFNENNTYKPDAGIKVAMQEFGHESLKAQQATIGDLAKQAYGKIEGQVNEQLLGRSDVPDQQGRQVADNKNVVADNVKAATNFMNAK